ncbi:hypothetical protein MW887_010863 [Aspergillus wentii]|nr:hypothetical protein MW887_010863 [Aspergillus wentii]
MQDDLGQLSTRLRLGLQSLQRLNDALGRVEPDMAVGDGVVGGDDVEDRPCVADTLGEKINIVGAVLIDLHSLVSIYPRHFLDQFGLVATKGVDLCVFDAYA